MEQVNNVTWLQQESTPGRIGVACGNICSPYCKTVMT